MAILNKMFDLSADADLAKSLGNILFSGVENDGSRKLYFNLLSNLLREKKTIVLVNGALSDAQHDTMLRFLSPHLGARKARDFALKGSTDSFNVLSAFSGTNQKAELIVNLLSTVSAMEPAAAMKAKRLYTYAMNALEAAGRSYTLKDLSAADIEYISELVEDSPLPEAEKRRSLRFLEDASTYSGYMDIESAMFELESCGLIEKLSGSLSAPEMLKEGSVIMLSGMIGDDFSKKELLFNSMFHALSKCIEKLGHRTAFLIKDADFISGDYIAATLKYNFSYDTAAYIFVEDISRYIGKNGNAILDDSKSFVVFNQGSDANAAFWSAHFGSRDVQEKSYSYTQKKGWNPFSGMMDSGGVIASPRKYKSSTTSIQKVNKPIYRPEAFRELKTDEAMIYRREPQLRRKARIEE